MNTYSSHLLTRSFGYNKEKIPRDYIKFKTIINDLNNNRGNCMDKIVYYNHYHELLINYGGNIYQLHCSRGKNMKR